MTADQLREAIQAQPFRPFVMHLADGRGIDVHHREFIMISPQGQTATVYQRDDTANIIDLLLVTVLEFAPEAKSKNV